MVEQSTLRRRSSVAQSFIEKGGNRSSLKAQEELIKAIGEENSTDQDASSDDVATGGKILVLVVLVVAAILGVSGCDWKYGE